MPGGGRGVDNFKNCVKPGDGLLELEIIPEAVTEDEGFGFFGVGTDAGL